MLGGIVGFMHHGAVRVGGDGGRLVAIAAPAFAAC